MEEENDICIDCNKVIDEDNICCKLCEKLVCIPCYEGNDRCKQCSSLCVGCRMPSENCTKQVGPPCLQCNENTCKLFAATFKSNRFESRPDSIYDRDFYCELCYDFFCVKNSNNYFLHGACNFDEEEWKQFLKEKEEYEEKKSLEQEQQAREERSNKRKMKQILWEQRKELDQQLLEMEGKSVDIERECELCHKPNKMVWILLENVMCPNNHIFMQGGTRIYSCRTKDTCKESPYLIHNDILMVEDECEICGLKVFDDVQLLVDSTNMHQLGTKQQNYPHQKYSKVSEFISDVWKTQHDDPERTC